MSTLPAYPSGGVAERELTRLLRESESAVELLEAEQRAAATPIGGHAMGDRVDALRGRVRARAAKLAE